MNYGLCNKDDINYGKGSDRKYVVQRRFNYSNLVKTYINSARQIICNNSKCLSTFDLELLSTIKLFDMLCPTCKKGTCTVENVSVKLESAEDHVLLPEFDIDFLNSLKIESPHYPTSLAKELDCTYQKVGKMAVKLKDKGYISAERKTINSTVGERNYYELTEKAKNIYFSD